MVLRISIVLLVRRVLFGRFINNPVHFIGANLKKQSQFIIAIIIIIQG